MERPTARKTNVKLLSMAAMLFVGLTPALAEDYDLDPAHTSIVFKIKHLGISSVYGRFNEVEGAISTGSSPSFQFTVKTDSVDTNNKKRDDHLRSPDFFNAKQFPVITFKSTEVHAHGDKLHVTGDLALHGVTKHIEVNLKKLGEAEMPKGTHRVGFETTFTLKRTDFGMDKMIGPAGDEVTLLISFEGTRK